MSAFLYGLALQWKLDIRSKTLFVTCYLVPLLFFALMGGIFTSINPYMKDTLIQSMTVMGVSMAALIGLPPTIVEVYGSDIRKAYIANGFPLPVNLITMFLSTLIHLLIMCSIILVAAPLAFDAKLPENILTYYISLVLYVTVTLAVGCVLGLLVKNQSKLTMISQLFFLPSIMLSGIMFPADYLPKVLGLAGKLFPASWGYQLMLSGGLRTGNLVPLLVIFLIAVFGVAYLLIRSSKASS